MNKKKIVIIIFFVLVIYFVMSSLLYMIVQYRIHEAEYTTIAFDYIQNNNVINEDFGFIQNWERYHNSKSEKNGTKNVFIRVFTEKKEIIISVNIGKSGDSWMALSYKILEMTDYGS